MVWRLTFQMCFRHLQQTQLTCVERCPMAFSTLLTVYSIQIDPYLYECVQFYTQNKCMCIYEFFTFTSRHIANSSRTQPIYQYKYQRWRLVLLCRYLVLLIKMAYAKLKKIQITTPIFRCKRCTITWRVFILICFQIACYSISLNLLIYA